MGYTYSLSQQFAAEVIGTGMLVFFGNAGVANALLPATKGHGMGLIGVAFSFGIGLLLPVQILGHISAIYNPAIAIGLAVSGDISGKQMGVAIAGELIGAFLGAFFVWLTYFDHFQPLQAILPSDDAEGGSGALVIKQELHPAAKSFASAGNQSIRKKVAVSAGDEDYSLSKVLRKLTGKVAVADEGAQNFITDGKAVKGHKAADTSLEQRVAEDKATKLSVFATRPGVVKHFFIFPLWTEFFGTFILTYVAVQTGVQRDVFLSGSTSALYTTGTQPFLVGLILLGLILSLGGVTGAALNPARDLGPRIAHFLLPIPGKGPSEWWYSWVPIVGPILGAIVGAQFSLAMKHLIKGGDMV